MRVVNKNSTKEIASNLIIADNILSRIKGLLGKKAMPDGEALLIKPCKGIHTFGMQFPIDVVFLDKRNRVVAMAKNVEPNRMTRVFFTAASVLELPAGTIDMTSTKIGDDVEIA